LSEHEGRAVLKGGDTGDSGKFSLRDSQGASSTDVVVDTMTLDNMLKRAKATAFDLLKIDVEGFEPAVLLGGARWIERHVPTVCLEYLPRWYHEDLDRAERAFSMMEKVGYQAFKLTGEEAGRLVLEPFETTQTLHRIEARDEMTNIVLIHPKRREHVDALAAFVVS
jgi:Methyltransferase FkbM domain